MLFIVSRGLTTATVGRGRTAPTRCAVEVEQGARREVRALLAVRVRLCEAEPDWCRHLRPLRRSARASRSNCLTCACHRAHGGSISGSPSLVVVLDQAVKG